MAYFLYGFYVFVFQADILSALSVEYPVSLKGSAQILSAQYGPDEGVSASHLTKPVKMDGSTVASRPNSSTLNSTKDASATVTTSSADSGNGALGTMRQRVHGPTTNSSF